MRFLRRPLSYLVLALAMIPAGLAMQGQLERALDIELRTQPRRTQTGRMQRGLPVGQGFVCEFDGLRQIDVALIAQGETQGAELELVLRQGSPTGQVLRRSTASQLPGQHGWGQFDFEPLQASQGKSYWWQLEILGERRQSPYSTWTRYHGQVGIDLAWGNRVIKEQITEGELSVPNWATEGASSYAKVPHPNLCAISFAVETLRPAVGPATLEIWGAEQEAFQSEPLREVSLALEEATHGGYAFFAFEPIANSRWKDFQFRLTVPKGARLVGTDKGLSYLTWHGLRSAQEGLLGMSRGELVQTDRSAIFRAYSEPNSLDLIARAFERSPWSIALGGLVWMLSLLCFAYAIRRP